MDAESSVSADLVLVALDAPRSHPPPARPRRATRAGPPPVGPDRSTPERNLKNTGTGRPPAAAGGPGPIIVTGPSGIRVIMMTAGL
jgi:hypothetical protein